jgi:hypothetical protein
MNYSGTSLGYFKRQMSFSKALNLVCTMPWLLVVQLHLIWFHRAFEGALSKMIASYILTNTVNDILLMPDDEGA